MLPIDSLNITTQLVGLLQSFIKLELPEEPAIGDASSSPHVACRFVLHSAVCAKYQKFFIGGILIYNSILDSIHVDLGNQSEEFVENPPQSRILAELKTRAFMVLSLEVRDPIFADEFLSFNNEITETMSSIAHLCTSG